MKGAELAIKYDAPFSQNGLSELERQERKGARSAGNALFRNGDKMPKERRKELEAILEKYFGGKFTQDLVSRAANLEHKVARANGK